MSFDPTEMPTMEEITEKLANLIGEIDTLFANVHPAIQGGALANVTARWLAGYVSKDEMRKIFESHSALVWQCALELFDQKNESQH